MSNVSDEETAVLNITWTWKGIQIGQGVSFDYGDLPPGKQVIKVSVTDGMNTVNTTLEVVVKADDTFFKVASPALLVLIIAVVTMATVLVVYIFRVRPKKEVE